jgi:hypothetical protein
MSIEELVDSFNDGEIEDNILPYFNDVLTFLKYATKNGFVMDLDLDQIPGNEIEECLPYIDELGLISRLNYAYVNEEIKNILLLYQLEKNPEQTLKYISDNLVTDVKPMNGGYYLYVKDREELADLFYSGSRREYGAHEYAKSMLGEDMWEPFWDTTDDVYKDVIEDLNEKNISILSEYIIKNIGGQEFSLDNYNDELFSDFSEKQETEGTFQITSENVMTLIGDEKAMKEMLKGGLSDLRGELYSIHSNAYNSAYETEVYNDVMSELETLFIGNIIDDQSVKNGITHYSQYIQIRDFYNDVHKFLSTFEGSGYNEDNLDYHGSYTEMIKHLMAEDEMQYLDFRIPDYPDGSVVDEYINDTFNDYI